MDYTHVYISPLGKIVLSSDGKFLTGLRFAENAVLSCERDAGLPVFAETMHWLDIYFGGKEPGFLPPFSVGGSEFQKAACRVLLKIPYGKTISYGKMAEMMSDECGRKVSARAAGGAAGRNPVAVIIPCHRVVGANGSLTGYNGGIERKIKLLGLENADMSHLFPPLAKHTAGKP